MHPSKKLFAQQGFTLIELSIVLVIIGLVVGGVLVGQDLIRAAEVCAQITQIEKYNQAANTFRGKYGTLPGDMDARTASQFGFAARAGSMGRGNGDGVMEGYCYPCGVSYGWSQGGETLLFWTDLSTANMIDGTFNTAGDSYLGNISSLTVINTLMPVAKIGRGNNVYVYSNYNGQTGNPGTSINFFGLSVPVNISGTQLTSGPAIPVTQAYNIDKKVDDGIPASGNVQADYATGATPPVYSTNTTTAGGNSSTCYDTTTGTYSVTIKGGSGPNCALSFQFQ